MRLDVYQTGSATILTAREAIVQAECEQLRSVVIEAMGSGRGRIVLDMAEAPYIDSAGLELLCDLHDVAAERGGSFKLAAPNEICQEILRITDLRERFAVYETVEQAAKSVV
jgi:anti-sigma B factor antagonist